MDLAVEAAVVVRQGVQVEVLDEPVESDGHPRGPDQVVLEKGFGQLEHLADLGEFGLDLLVPGLLDTHPQVVELQALDVAAQVAGGHGACVHDTLFPRRRPAPAPAPAPDAYGIRAIGIDHENTDEFENTVVQDRILGAPKIVKQNNPGLKTIVTIARSDWQFTSMTVGFPG